jgi:GTP-binding protein
VRARVERETLVKLAKQEVVASEPDKVPVSARGKLFAAEGDNVYEGQLVGIHSKDNDLTVNAIKTKPLTNMRASGKDDAIKLTPAIKYTLEQALDFIEDDELVEVTPKEIRLRKKFLTETDRKRASRAA